MNILVLSWRDPKHPLAGGAEQVMHEHMKGWVAAGHTVTFYSSSFPGAKRREKIDGIRVIRRGYQIFGVHIAAALWYLFTKHEKFDLVVDQFHGTPFFTPLYIRVKKLAVIQEVAGEVWRKNDFPKPFNWIVAFLGYYSEPLFFLFYRNVKFITGSQSAADDLKKIGIKRGNISIIPHGVIIEESKKMPKKERVKTVVFLGALSRDKGIEDALKAFSILNRKGEYKFWVVGKGGGRYVARLNKLCEELGVSVKFWGFVSPKKKFELLALAHILINPSVLEGWGLVNIEANRMRTPVVAYKSRGLIDSVKHNQSGILVNKNTPEKLAEAIEKILSNKPGYEKLQKGAVKWSEQFDWEKSKKMSLQIIENI